MSAPNKYLVFKLEDARAFLTGEELDFLTKIQAKISNARMVAGKPPVAIFFPLNLTSDIYALAAAEAYIDAIRADFDTEELEAKMPAGIREAMSTALEKLRRAALMGTQGAPD